MDEEVECLCMGCGTYHLIPVEDVKLEYLEDFQRKRLKDMGCPGAAVNWC